MFSYLSLFECSVLISTLPEKSMPWAFVGGLSPCQGDGKITSGRWDCPRVNCGHVLRIGSDIILTFKAEAEEKCCTVKGRLVTETMITSKFQETITLILGLKSRPRFYASRLVEHPCSNHFFLVNYWKLERRARRTSIGRLCEPLPSVHHGYV